MGFAAVAGHLVILVAVVSAGTVLVAALSDSSSDVVNAQSDAIHRMQEARAEELELESDFFSSSADLVMANWTNEGSEELRFDELSLLVGGDVVDKDTVDRFEVRSDADSEVWAPDEVLEVEVGGEGDAHLGLVALHGTADYRRP